MRHRKYLCFIVLLFSVNCFAASASTNLTQLLQNLKTYQANFTQVIQDTNGDVLQKSNGTMALQRPGRFRWDTLKPNQQLIVADGKSIWIYDRDLQQVTQQKQTTDSQSPGLLLSDSVTHLASRYSISSPRQNVFDLRPKRNKDLFKSVELDFDNNGALNKMTLHDNLGQITTIQFTDSIPNRPLPDYLFRFTPPKDADVMQG